MIKTRITRILNTILGSIMFVMGLVVCMVGIAGILPNDIFNFDSSILSSNSFIINILSIISGFLVGLVGITKMINIEKHGNIQQ